MKSYVVVGLMTLCLLNACAKPRGPSTPLELEGFKPFASARSFDGPGRIFRIEPNGDVFGVTTLKLTPKSGTEAIPKIEKHSNVSLEEMLTTIGVAATTFPAVGQADLKMKREAVTESVNGKREYLDDDAIDPILREVLKGVRVRPNNQYYLIRETVSANNINFTMDKSWVSSLGIEVPFKKVVSSKSTLKWEGGTKFSLNQQFSEPLRLWYKADKILFKTDLGAGPGQPTEIDKRVKNSTEFNLPATPIDVKQ